MLPASNVALSPFVHPLVVVVVTMVVVVAVVAGGPGTDCVCVDAGVVGPAKEGLMPIPLHAVTFEGWEGLLYQLGPANNWMPGMTSSAGATVKLPSELTEVPKNKPKDPLRLFEE